MDIPPRIPTRTSEHATQQAGESHQTTGNSTANAARNNAAGPLPRAAGNLGQTVQSEIGQQGNNVSASRRPLRVSINETANINFDIPTRKQTLVDMLTRAGLELSQAMEQNPDKLSDLQHQTASVLISAIDLLKTKIEKSGNDSRAEKKQLKEETLKLINVAEGLVKIATPAPAPEPAQGVDEAPRLPTRN